MTGSLIGSIILWLIVAIIAIVVIVYLLNWLYHRSTKEIAFVRTGFGGEKVVINGGALVLPIVHEVTPVNLNVVRIPITRTKEQAVITRDRMRVDIEAEFFVRVVQKKDAVAAAASTLGRRTLDADGLSGLLSGKFIGALRSVAAERTLDEMHEKRGDFVATVEERAASALAQNGLELESVAITDLDQTHLEFFDPSNRFDAEGLTQLIETIEARRKLRNDIEQSSMLAIRARNLEAERETLKLEQESEDARLAQQRAIEALRAQQRAEILRTQVSNESEAEKARIASQQETRSFEIERRRALEEAEIKAHEEIERARIAQERALRHEQIQQRHDIESAEITANEDVERARILSQRQLREAQIIAEEETETREIARGKQLDTARIAAQKDTDTARIALDQVLDKARIERDRQLRAQQIAQRQSIEEAEIAAREEVERSRIASDRGLEEARIIQQRDLRRLDVEREMAIELAEIAGRIEVLKKSAEEAASQTETEGAKAKAIAAAEKVTTVRETEVAERLAAVDRLIASKDADTARIAAEADKLTAAVAAEAQRLRNEAENILSEDARAGRLREKMIDRLEGIVRESVRPMEKIDGIKILHVDGLTGGSGGGHRSPTDEVIESALRYRAQAPLIDEMMKEIGIENAGVAKMGDIFRSAKDAASLAKDTAGKEVAPPKKSEDR